MAHFAKLDSNSIIIDVIVVDNTHAPDPAPSVSEPLGQQYIATMSANDERLMGRFVQTSYHGNFRKQYCGPGFRYDAEADVFIAPQPFPSWTLDANHDWQPPTPMPTEGGPWVWDEESASWVEVAA